jgi:thiosulfate/3-mercaptopyruvate sulfurtransferase
MKIMTKALRCLAVLALPLVLSVCSFAGAGAAHPEMVVSAQWLADHLKDPKVVVLHVADKVADYRRGHIPGARYLSTDDFTTGNDVELPAVDKLKAVFEKLGVSDDTRVVIYTTAWPPTAGRAFFTLDYLGHDKTSLLDGGIEHWILEQRPITTETPQVTSGKFTPHVHEEARALLGEAKQATEPDSKELLVDSRPMRRYKDGHPAGAVPVYWQETLVDPNDDPVFLSPEKLRALFESRGIKPGKKLVTYCEVGLQASHVYFVAKYLGYDAAMYDGSMHEWSMVNNLPVVKGDSVR